MSNKNPVKNSIRFVQEVKSETQKVTWPSKKEMIASTCLLYTSPSPRDA